MTLTHAADVKKVRIKFDSEAPVEFLGTSWAKLNISPGLHEIHITTIDAPIQTIAKVVDVEPSAVAKLDIKIGK